MKKVLAQAQALIASKEYAKAEKELLPLSESEELTSELRGTYNILLAESRMFLGCHDGVAENRRSGSDRYEVMEKPDIR